MLCQQFATEVPQLLLQRSHKQKGFAAVVPVQYSYVLHGFFILA
ncbi:protein of unknown function [Shewanella benthica]|uniref:Uncharacterized protein n=1 Tax=Shewanella benthica TaxID=43661 RepID=A0A330M6A2_9GAMM|nr:protein of unknown function [Shewanella benthica]